MPPAVVKSQVSSQIKVRDLSRATVSIAPADAPSWTAARANLIVEAKAPLKAQLAAELSACDDDDRIAEIRAKYDTFERDLEFQVDHKPLEVNLELELNYNFLSK